MMFKCKMCGGDIEQIENTNTGKCIYCKSVMTLPNLDNERIVNLYNRANALRLANDFDKAHEVYENILGIDNNQIEAHWGILLCKYGVEYVDDPNTKEKIPTCHRTNDYSILLDQDFKLIKKESFGEALKLYEKEAKQIDEIQKNILAISKKEKPYDVFICYKESDEKGERTHDSVIAQDIYDKLVEQGHKVFFARITLEDKLGQEYEPYIYSALKSSKVMLVVGTKEEHFNAVWVKNEWSRYLEMMKADKGKALIPVYSKIDAYKLPEEFAMLQAQSMDKVGAIQDLVRGVGKIVKEYKTEEVEGVDKETVAKVKAVLDDARNLGNGQYEVTILKENLPVWYYVINVVGLCILGFLYFVGIIGGIRFDQGFSGHEIYFITRPYLLKFSIFFYIISGLMTFIYFVCSVKERKSYKVKKIFQVGAVFFLTMTFLTAATKRLIPNIYSIVLYIVMIALHFFFFILNPSWTINSSTKSIMTAEEKDKQLEKNKYIKENFKVKEKTKLKIPFYIILLVIIGIYSFKAYNTILPENQSNGQNPKKSQVEILSAKFMYSEPHGYYSEDSFYSRDFTINKITKGDYYDILDIQRNGVNQFIKIKTNHNIGGWIIFNEKVKVNCHKSDQKCINGITQTNKRDSNVPQLIVIEPHINIREEDSVGSQKIGQVFKDEIYTILETSKIGCDNTMNLKYCQRWYKIKTTNGLEGWIAGTIDEEQYVQLY